MAITKVFLFENDKGIGFLGIEGFLCVCSSFLNPPIGEVFNDNLIKIQCGFFGNLDEKIYRMAAISEESMGDPRHGDFCGFLCWSRRLCPGSEDEFRGYGGPSGKGRMDEWLP